ncbi:MAG: mechanosensitive ion channel family protein [Clostridia bacterium]|nr:mechanosensitive ion channel family protein [Clostridia bacterium]
MRIFKTSAEIDLTDIDLSNVSENISNADKIFETVVNKIGEYLADIGINLILSLFLLIAGWKLINILSKKMKEGRIFGKIEPTARSFIRSALTIVLKILLVITIAAILGVPMTSMVAVISSCGLAIGLALQGSLSNIAGGFILTVFKPFVVGDYIKSGEFEGTVKAINIFYTKIITVDNKIIVIPNSKVSDSALIDYNAFDTRRVDIDITAAYSADSDDVKKALIDIANDNNNIMQDPAPVAVIKSFNDSAVAYQLRVWTKTENYWDVKFEVTEKIKKIFEERNIPIPFPQMDIHITKEYT